MSGVGEPSSTLLTTSEAVDQFCRAVVGSPFVAVDTEFQWDRTYFAGLGLVQMATPEQVGLVDCVAIDDFTPLKQILCTPASVKVFHSASQDLSILGRVLKAPVVNIYDTQIAHAILGGSHQASYAKLAADYLGLAVDKSLQHTDWLRRPLSEKQLTYAAADVIHLAEIYPLQRERLRACGRLSWALEDSAWLEANPPCEATDPEMAFATVAGGGRLPARHLHNLKCLAEWRERHCLANGLRPRWLIADRILLGMAVAGRFDQGILAKEKRWIARRVVRFRGAIEDVLATAARTPDEQLPEVVKHRRPTPLEKRLADTADTAVAAKAKTLGVEKALLASRAEFTSLAHHLSRHGEAPAEARLYTGWRREVLGEELVAEILPLCQGTEPS